MIKIFAAAFQYIKKYNPENETQGGSFIPSVSVIITVYNEEDKIQSRIENILHSNYPSGQLELIVASDGSNDKTVAIAKKYKSEGVLVLDEKIRQGRAIIQNLAVKHAGADILVFTDANTVFDINFIENIVAPYRNKVVGAVIGNLIYRTRDTSISESEGLYWRLEKELRKSESILGLLATGTGACMSVRKSLWRELTPIDDCDFTSPLDVILQGYKVVFSESAIAYDEPASTIKHELNTRIRQTSKNLVGTLKRWGLKGFIRHPLVSWGLLSHKVLRWMTIFFLVSIFISNGFLLDFLFYKTVFYIEMLLYFIIFLNMLMEIIFHKRIRGISNVSSFLLAGIGMGLGVIRGAFGGGQSAYDPNK